jgi:hypothetical protein
MKSTGSSQDWRASSTPNQRPHFKEDAKSLVARATAKKSGERVGFERAVGDRMLLCDEIRGEPTQALKPIPIPPRN